MIVMKFGGTSVGSADAIERVVEIVRSRLPREPVVVSSATAKTTDELVSLAQAAASRDREKTTALADWIIKKHVVILSQLGLRDDPSMIHLLDEVTRELVRVTERLFEAGAVEKELLDDCLSWGEYLSCNILPCFLRTQGIPSRWVDARQVFFTDSRFGKARPVVGESKPRAVNQILPVVDAGEVPVVQGFIGSDARGRITTFGRGGSDYSATALGGLLSVDAVEIWTDVDGIMTADPSLVQEVKRIRRMTFEEAAELAYFGAKVLHPATLLPAVEAGISVWVLNSMNPSLPGTEILPETGAAETDLPVVKSIAYKEGLTVLDIKSSRMLMAYGFLATIFGIFNRYETPVDLVATSEVSVSLTIDNLENIELILKELSAVAEVEMRREQAVVCLVGSNICRQPGLPGQVFSQLEDVAVNLISQGASKINISFVIDESDLPRVINRLHESFFTRDLNEAIFA